MNKIISFRVAGNVNLLIYGFLLLFHLAIVVGIAFFDYVPLDYLWGGRMETRDQLLVFEIISFIVSLICLLLTLIKTDYLRIPKLKKIAHFGMWILFILFSFNTVGNILAKTNFERIFGVLTIMLAIFSLRLALETEKNDNSHNTKR